MNLSPDVLDPLTRALRLAETGTEAADALRRLDLASLLESSTEVLGIERDWWARPTTIAGLLRLRARDLPRHERLALLRFVRFQAAVQALPPLPPPGGEPDALRRWFTQVDLPGDPDEPVVVLSESLAKLAQDEPGLSSRPLAEVWSLPPALSSDRRFTRTSRRAPKLPVLHRIAGGLRSIAGIALEGRIGHAALLAAPPPADPRLAELWRALLHELQGVTHAPVGQVMVPPWIKLDAVRGGRLRVQDPRADLELRLRRPPGSPILVEDVNPDVLASALYEILDDWRFGGATAAVIQESLSWELDLGDLRALVPPVQRSDGPPLGFRLKMARRGWTIVPVLVSTSRRGLKHRALKDTESPLAHAVESGDREALRLLGRAAALRDTAAAQEPLAEAVRALVGHPRFFVDSKAIRPTPVERVRFGLTLRALPEGWVQARWRVGDREYATSALLERLLFDLRPTQPIAVVLDAPSVPLRICELGEPSMELLELLSRIEDLVPPELVDPLLPRLFPLDDLDLLLDRTLEGRRVPASPTPTLRLRSTPEGLVVALRVAPGLDGRTFPPGLGPPALRGVDAQGRWTCVRNLDAERRAAAARWAALAVGRPPPIEPTALPLPEAVPLLDALATEDPPGPVAWSGPERRVSSAGASALALRVRSSGRLLALGGAIRVADAEIPLGQVLDALRGGRRFVEVDAGRIVRLHDELAAELQRLADASWTDRDGEERLSVVSADAIEAVQLQGAAVDAHADWGAQRQRLAQARAHEPTIPADLRATLRPYQADGVRWLLRLGAWGLGAVLADDMGLGKTVQGLAVLLARGAEGPALVVAPTSMVGTWAREAARFAPRLRTILHHGPGRATNIADLGPDAVLLTSWGTLVQDADLLASCRFTTVVLDEAHAIKNPGTRRAQAARALDADFIVALTGTPVENHPGELWSIFRVVAPGLLGSREAFEERFGRPILEDPSGPERDRLAALIRPFLLRRTKAQVATDLPPREEIVVEVSLDPEERRLYEGVRRAALAELPSPEVGAIPILAALTRLRQAACHPGLIAEGFPDSSKLRAARRTLADLRESGHKALVFSQFVRLLDKLAPQLVAEGYRVGRLDGRTSRPAREEVVDAFQRGGLDVLLLSLKAGGVGLTLTAASYVLHLDPWWNPAVQDQATDRAHRIGQDQPVTALHFVTTSTVEVGIRELQATKRELVEGLLEGSGAAATLDAAALLRLLQQGGEGD